MRIKEYTSPISGEVAMLVDDAEMPLQFANRYTFSQIEKNGKSLSSVKQALFVISRAYLWAETQSMELERLLFYGDYLTHDQVQDLVEFIQYTSATQRNILRHKKEQPPHSSKHRGNINTFKKTVEFKYHRTSNQVYANRLNALRKFLRWVLRERLAQGIPTSGSVKDRSAIAIEVINTSTPKVRRRSDNEKLEAVDLEIIQRISEVLQPEHPDNPFSSQFVRRRNHLLFLLLIESGARRREVYETTSKDIIASTLQYDIKVTKTIPRTLPVSSKLIDAFEAFYKEHWQHLTGSGKKAGYLFVKSNGERMTLRALNHVIETVREKIPEVPEWFHTHTIRRSFNHRLSLLIDAKRKEGIRISEEEERKMRNRLNGWAQKSNMGEIYNARHLREKADRLAEMALSDIWTGELVMGSSSAMSADVSFSPRSIQLLDGRIALALFDKPFIISSDSRDHQIDFSWINANSFWGASILDALLKLFSTHSVQYASTVTYYAKRLLTQSNIKKNSPLSLEDILCFADQTSPSYWPFLQPLLKRVAKLDQRGVLADDLKSFLNQPNKWEEKGKGAYFALVTNDLTHGALTEQELYSIQEGVNSAYERGRINLEEYALVWFLVGTGVRPIQVARMKAGDIKIYDGPEGKEVTLYVPLAKGEATSDQGKWRRRCPTILAEILITYLNETRRKDSQSLFADQSTKIGRSIKSIFDRVETYSERTEGPINIFPYRFRYTLGTRAIAQGGSDKEVARLLTHRNTFSVASYRAAMPHLQKPIKDALSGEMSLIATAFKGRLITGLDDATRKGQVDALVRDFLHLNGEAVGACGTESACHQHAPIACLTCQKFEPFSNSPWDELLDELQADMDSEDEDRIKLITLPSIEAVKEIMRKCKRRKAGTNK